MRYLLQLLFWFVVLVGCTNTTVTCPAGSLKGNDGSCNYCSYGTPETYTGPGCSSLNSSGVACCGYGNVTGTVSCTASYPYLCSNGECWNKANGNGSLTCVSCYPSCSY